MTNHMRAKLILMNSTISRAAFDRAVYAACKTVGPKPPPWFRRLTEIKVLAALKSLGITVRGLPNVKDEPRP